LIQLGLSRAGVALIQPFEDLAVLGGFRIESRLGTRPIYLRYSLFSIARLRRRAPGFQPEDRWLLRNRSAAKVKANGHSNPKNTNQYKKISQAHASGSDKWS